MSSFIIKVVGVIFATACAEILLPSGKIRNSCRTVLAIVCVAVFASPLANLKDIEFDFSNAFENEIVDVGYVEDTERYYCKIFESEVVDFLHDNGIECLEANVDGELKGGQFAIKNITVKIKKQVISGKDEHIISIVKIKSMLAKNLSVKEERVSVYECEE